MTSHNLVAGDLLASEMVHCCRLGRADEGCVVAAELEPCKHAALLASLLIPNGLRSTHWEPGKVTKFSVSVVADFAHGLLQNLRIVQVQITR